ncbi:MAG TPA: protease inhibitor I42 family protein [Mycobacteriales bacterium]|nr:protease inhibitor I42 family protein [Mycobacteriales bacterium]
MTQTIARVALISSALLVAAAPIADSASAAAATHVYKQSDSGKTVSLSKGTVFKVRLKVCEDCGYSWSWKHRPDAKVVKVVKKRDVSSAKPPAVGGINTVTWTMKVVGRGDTKLKLVQHSPAQQVTKRFKLSIAAG